MGKILFRDSGHLGEWGVSSQGEVMTRPQALTPDQDLKPKER